MTTPAIFVSGLPGVGKTTLCRAVARRLGIRFLRFDDLVTNAPPQPFDFAKLIEAAKPLFTRHLTLCDSFPKGAAQAEVLEPVARPVLMLCVEDDPVVAAERAQRRSPRRFTPERIREKFAKRAEQTAELRRYCTSRGTPIAELRNGPERSAFLEAGIHIIAKTVRTENLHATE